MHRRIPLATAAVVLLGSLVPACSSDSNLAGKPNTTLGKALSRVQNTADTRHYVEFGRPADSLRANGTAFADGGYRLAVGQGLGLLLRVSKLVQEKLGFDPLSADYAITAGRPPSTGGLISGVNLGGTGPRLEALGGKQIDGARGTTYRFRPDHRIGYDDKLGRAFAGVPTDLNVVQIDGSTFRRGSGKAEVELTDASGSSLLDDGAMRSVAGCLGEPLAAVLTDQLPTPPARLPAQRQPRPITGLQTIGVGLSGKRGAQPLEQLCVVADSPARAKAIGTRIENALANSVSVRANVRWSQLLERSKVTTTGSVVNVTAYARGQQRGGLLLQALPAGDLPGLSG